MRNNEFKNAGEYIEYQYKKWFDSRDLSSIPDSLLEDFDLKKFGHNANYKDIYTILKKDIPSYEIESFIKLIDSNNREQLKSFSFSQSEALVNKFNIVIDAMIECSEETMLSDIEVGNDISDKPEEQMDLELISDIEITYDTEAKRLIKELKKAINIGKEFINSLTETSDLDSSDLKNILSYVNDDSKMTPESILASAIYIYKQTQTNVMSDDVVRKLESIFR